MNYKRDIDEKLIQLKQKIQYFGESVCLCMRCEGASNNEDLDQAWATILNEVVRSAETLIMELAEEIRWSLLDAHQEVFDELYGMLCLHESLLKQRPGVQVDSSALHNACLALIGRKDGRQQDEPQDEDYCRELFYREYHLFKEENFRRIEETYQQDSDDNAYDYPDANDRKNRMSKERRQTLFADFYGSYYHDHGRDITELTLYIIAQKEPDYERIYAFFKKYMALEYADSQLRDTNDRQQNENIIFCANADVDKIMDKLLEMVEAKLLRSQRHWFIVYKVMNAKGWLAKDNQQKFRDQINARFKGILKCTKDDFKEVDSYFKQKDFADWSMDDPKAPVCCREYKEIADALHLEFQERKYAKSGLLITTQRMLKHFL